MQFLCETHHGFADIAYFCGELKNEDMAIPVTNIPVLTGEVAERFIEQCEYNAKHLAGSEWSQEREDRFNRIMKRSLELQRKLGVR